MCSIFRHKKSRTKNKMELIGIIINRSGARPYVYFHTHPWLSRRINWFVPHKKGDRVRCYISDTGACIPLENLD